MQEIETNIFRSEPIELSELRAQLCSFILRRDDGNILVYGGGNFRDHKEQIKKIGGIKIQAISHRHEFTRHPDWVRSEFGATRYCHEDELPALPETFGVDIAFGKELEITADFAAISTPGHCPGSACFTWNSGSRIYAFVGDTLYLKNGMWDVNVTNSYGSPHDAAESLRKLSQYEFDVLVPGIYYDGLNFPTVSSSRLRAELGPLLDRLEEDQV